MARRPFDKFTRVAWCTTIADISAPTVAELEAGTDLSLFVPKDGVRPSGTQNTVDQGDITTSFEGKTTGTDSEDFELMLYRDDTDDDAWDLCVQHTVGYLVIRYLVPFDDAWAAGDKVEVRKCQMGEPQMANSTGNENMKFSEKFAISTRDKRAVVAA